MRSLPLKYTRIPLLICLLSASFLISAAQIDLSPPINANISSVNFGSSVLVLPNGNFAVADNAATVSGASEAGAVYLFNPAGTLISTLTGSHTQDHVGDELKAVGTSNFVVVSYQWDNGAVADVGAVTWVNGTTGLNASVGSGNSLIGAFLGDEIGFGDVTLLSNGNYVVGSPYWGNFAGAATWGSGNSGVAGAVSQSNSLVGSALTDSVGQYVVALTGNGNYVVQSASWNNGAGAATWGDGGNAVGGVKGLVSASNSLVGAASNDLVGERVTPLTNGNYVVASPNWNGLRGAATWGNGTVRTPVGAVTIANSITGSSVGDQIGSGATAALTNGNYVVSSPGWHAGATPVGAATWGTGAGPTGVPVSQANSLVGNLSGDAVSSGGITALSNGNYVVASIQWNYNEFAPVVGAVTWANGDGSTIGNVLPINSLYGYAPNDYVGSGGVTPLTNGNYTVASPLWDSQSPSATDAGAITWGDGSVLSGGVSGEVQVLFAPYSIRGDSLNDQVALNGAVALANGNYVFASPYWHDSSNTSVGSVTWANGSTASDSLVSEINSLVGSTDQDRIGNSGIVALKNGNYVVASSNWNGVAASGGAVSWLNGNSGHSGVVSPSNSLYGTHSGDAISASNKIIEMSDGNYVIVSAQWNSYRGAITLASSKFRLVGPIASWNSVLGGAVDGGASQVYSYDATRHRVAVGRPAENLVSLFTAEQVFADNLEP